MNIFFAKIKCFINISEKGTENAKNSREYSKNEHILSSRRVENIRNLMCKIHKNTKNNRKNL